MSWIKYDDQQYRAKFREYLKTGNTVLRDDCVDVACRFAEFRTRKIAALHDNLSAFDVEEIICECNYFIHTGIDKYDPQYSLSNFAYLQSKVGYESWRRRKMGTKAGKMLTYAHALDAYAESSEIAVEEPEVFTDEDKRAMWRCAIRMIVERGIPEEYRLARYLLRGRSLKQIRHYFKVTGLDNVKFQKMLKELRSELWDRLDEQCLKKPKV